MADIFLSYSRKDADFSDQLVKDLKAEGLDVWIDDQGLAPGDPSWRIVIERVIEQAECTLVLLSPNVKSSVEVRNEISYSKAQGKRVIPVLIAGDQKSAAPSNLIETHYVDLRTQYQENFPHLVKALKNLISHASITNKGATLETKWWTIGTATKGMDRQSVKRDIVSVLSSFYSKNLPLKEATSGVVKVSMTNIGIILSLWLSIGLARGSRSTIVDKLVKLGFVGGSLVDQLNYSSGNHPDSFSKFWEDPEPNLERLADDIIDANLIMGRSIDNIKIESNF